MKKLTKTFCTSTLLLALFNTNPLVAQSTQGSDDHCFNENTKILNIGVGFGAAYYKYSKTLGYDYSRTPALSVSYEQAFPKKLGIGYLGLGGYVGYQHASLRYDDIYFNSYYYKHNWNYFVITARGAYHFDVVNWKKGELYAGAMVGLRIQTYNYETNSTSPYIASSKLNDGSVYPTFSFFAGARYYFTKNFGVYGEIGSGISYATGGLSFKF